MNITELVNTPEENRNFDWENQLFRLLPNLNLNILDENPIVGPDGFSYLMAEPTEEEGEPFLKVVQWLHDKGIGLVLNPMKQYPDYVFTYGMIWSYKEFGEFYRPKESHSGAVEFKMDQELYVGQPTEAFLPMYVRKLIKQFLLDQGCFAPKINMLSQNQKHFDLAFSLESIGNPPENEHQGIAEALSWFLPPHYSLLLISEKNIPSFKEL